MQLPALGPVLVANRGEIAVRIIRCCRELGLRSAAVFSDADTDALHVRLADEAHRIGPAPARESYLDVDAVLTAAKAAGAGAVHPGYGLLSEDAAFAAAVTAAGFVFVGPPAKVVATMGDKVAARAIAVECGVPVVPGSDGPVDPDNPAEVAELAHRLGWPVLVKACFGGGGRGLRVVDDEAGLAAALAAAGREAQAAFGRSEVHLERYLPRSRHVEVQILADAHGTVLQLGDRDCSVQRRHQKLLEEAPAPGLAPTLRATLAEAALRIARRVGYRGAGTVEFLVLPDTGEHFFLEMNTRLQVEHGVTELVTGVDLVAAQLRVAAGEPLGLGQLDVSPHGHAVQARIAAEDPGADFRPAPGRVTELVPPLGPWLRTDLGIAAGDPVPAEYDSLVGKVLAWGPDRDTARRRLIGALDELRVVGVPTTGPYLRRVLASELFAANGHDTGSVARDWPPDHLPPEPPGVDAAAPPVPPVRRVRIATDRGPVEIAVFGAAPAAVVGAAAPGAAAAVRARRADPAPASTAGSTTAPAAGADPVAPMDATVVAVPVAFGQRVLAGAVLAVLEAMKMEIEVRATRPGTVGEILVAPGQPVPAGHPLLHLHP